MADAKARHSGKEDHTDEDYAMFVDMVHKMVTYEPAERIKPHEALVHPFLPVAQRLGPEPGPEPAPEPGPEPGAEWVTATPVP